jgi:hypothetical protein
MKLKFLLNRFARRSGRVVVSFGEAELRGGSRPERQAAREWVSHFQHEAAVDW